MPQGNHGFSRSVVDRWMGALAGCESTSRGGTEAGLAIKTFRATKGALREANGDARHGHPQGSNGAWQWEPTKRSGWRLSPEAEHAAETRKARATRKRRQADRSPATGGRQQCWPPIALWWHRPLPRLMPRTCHKFAAAPHNPRCAPGLSGPGDHGISTGPDCLFRFSRLLFPSFATI